MPQSTSKLAAAVEAYFDHLRLIRASGGATAERSYYPPLVNLLNAVGGTLRPRVFCIGELAQQGAGHPDMGLYAARQVQKGRPREGQTPDAVWWRSSPPGTIPAFTDCPPFQPFNSMTFNISLQDSGGYPL